MKKWDREHPERRRELRKQWNLAHADLIREQSKKRYNEHREEIMQRNKEWYRAHREYAIEQSKKWIREHPGAILRIVSEWKRKHPEAARQHKKQNESLRRGYGPFKMILNKPFPRAHLHHVDFGIGAYIPKLLHESVPHCLRTGRGMIEINEVVANWIGNSDASNYPIQIDSMTLSPLR